MSLGILKLMVYNFSALKMLECESCQLGKHCRSRSESITLSKAESVLNSSHSNVWGSSHKCSKLDFGYFVTFINNLYHTTWFYLMKD